MLVTTQLGDHVGWDRRRRGVLFYVSYCLTALMAHSSGMGGTHDNSTSNDVEHVSIVLLWGNLLPAQRFFVSKQTSNSREMDISRQECQSSVHVQDEFLTFEDEPITFLLVNVGAPMIVKVV